LQEFRLERHRDAKGPEHEKIGRNDRCSCQQGRIQTSIRPNWSGSTRPSSGQELARCEARWLRRRRSFGCRAAKTQLGQSKNGVQIA
jgi:hypothetical protein